VELACSTTLVPAYHPDFFNKLVDASGRKDEKRPVVVFVVCGGFKIDLQTATEYQELAKADPNGDKKSWSVEYDDGQLFSFSRK
jgi:L-serine/L-threonine ammonia-lyase